MHSVSLTVPSMFWRRVFVSIFVVTALGGIGAELWLIHRDLDRIWGEQRRFGRSTVLHESEPAGVDAKVLKAILDLLPVESTIQAETWDELNAVTSAADFHERFRKVAIPEVAKSALFDLKFPHCPAARSFILDPAELSSVSDTDAPAAKP